WRIAYIVKFGPKLITSTQHCKSTFQIEAQNHSLQKKEKKKKTLKCGIRCGYTRYMPRNYLTRHRCKFACQLNKRIVYRHFVTVQTMPAWLTVSLLDTNKSNNKPQYRTNHIATNPIICRKSCISHSEPRSPIDPES
ncbi:hypothetical protein COCCADRAFT_85238, partial [Bipolaris zeicola 26-R-13]